MVTTERRKSFPERIAIVEPRKQKAYEIRFSKEEAFSNVVELKHGEARAVQFKTRCAVCDAVLIVRPFVRIVDGEVPLDGILRFLVDGETVVDNESLAKYVAKDMRDPVLDVPVKWPEESTRIPGLAPSSLYYAAAMTEKGAEPGKGMYGIFAPTLSDLAIELLEIRCPQMLLRVEVGCIAARYTTNL